jgi:hypothetical protein
MAMYEKKAYKNPKIAGSPGQIASAGQQAPSAPPRAGGMMQMAALARLKQPKPGQPPIPVTKPFDPRQRPSGATAGPAPAYDPAKQAAAKRILSAGGKAMGGGPQVPGMNQVLTSLEPGTGITPAYAGGIDAVGTPVGDIGGLEAPFQYDILKAEGSGQGGDMPVVPAEEPEPTEGGIKPKFDEAPEDSPWITGDWTGTGVEDAEKILAAGQSTADEEAQAVVDAFTQEAESKGFKPLVDDFGNQIGWTDTFGNQYDAKGDPLVWDDEPQTDTEYKSDNLTKQVVDQMFDYLGEETGISKEELAGQISQLKMASSEQIADFAQQMAARGMGASGLLGQGMGQIASQTVGAIANLRFENAKLAIDEKLNKMKAYMAMYGQGLSEENRMAIFEMMHALEQDKWDTQKEQDSLSNKYIEFNNMASLAQVYDEGALAFILDSLSDPNKSAGDVFDSITLYKEDGLWHLKKKDDEQQSGSPDKATWAKAEKKAESEYEKYVNSIVSDEEYANKFTLNQFAQAKGFKDWNDYINSFVE